MMKRFLKITFVLVCFAGTFVKAQQRPQFTQFMLNGFVYNPAMTGINNYTDVKAGYRKQWVGVTGAPTTYYMGVHSKLGKPEPNQSLPVRGRLANKFNTTAPSVNENTSHALGGYYLGDRTGPTGFNSVYLNYAYHAKLGSNLNFSVGGSFGLSQFFLDTKKMGDYQDNALGAGFSEKVNPDLSLGAMLHSNNFFLGYSATQLFRNKLKLLNSSIEAGRLQVHHFTTFGYNFQLSEDLGIVPSVVAKFNDKVPVSYDVNLRINVKELLWFGGSYRNEDSFSGLVGVNLPNNIYFGYSYDVVTSKYKNQSSGSHEIVAGFRIGKKGKSVSVPTMW